jgi:hypothetical protein
MGIHIAWIIWSPLFWLDHRSAATPGPAPPRPDLQHSTPWPELGIDRLVGCQHTERSQANRTRNETQEKPSISIVLVGGPTAPTQWLEQPRTHSGLVLGSSPVGPTTLPSGRNARTSSARANGHACPFGRRLGGCHTPASTAPLPRQSAHIQDCEATAASLSLRPAPAICPAFASWQSGSCEATQASPRRPLDRQEPSWWRPGPE